MVITIQGDTANSTQSSHAYNAVTGAKNTNYSSGGSSGGSGSNIIKYSATDGSKLALGASTTDALGNTYKQGTPFVDTKTLSGTGQPLKLPTQTDTNNYSSIINGITSGQISQTDAQNEGIDLATKNSTDMYKSLLDSIGAPPSSADAYKKAQNETGILGKQQLVTDLTGKLNTITANGQAQQISLTGQGRGIPEAIIGGQQAEIGRETAIAALPVSAELNAAQGNLQMAQQNLNTLFQIYSTDATNAYNYKKDSAMAVYDIANKGEQKKLDSFLQNIKDIHDTTQTNINFASTLSTEILKAGNKPPDFTKIDFSNPKAQTQMLSMSNGLLTDKLDRAYKIAQINHMKAQDNPNSGSGGLGGIVSPVAKLPNGTYDKATQDLILSKMSPTDAALVKQVGTYQMDISKITSLRSNAREALAAKVALVYPGFEMSQYAANAAYRKGLASTTQGSTGAAINSANKVINHLVSYVGNVNKLNNGQFTALNSIANNSAFFRPDIQTANAEATTNATGVKDELAKFFKGTGVADVTSIADWGKTVNVNANPAKQRGSVQGAIDLLQGQLVPMIDQYKQTLGQEPPDGLFLKADTIQKLSTLKNQGYKINIPGVYYTDKSAWQKYGGGTQDDWNNAITNLQNAGLPITTENILQASQLY